jgi:hypothetical protein
VVIDPRNYYGGRYTFLRILKINFSGFETEFAFEKYCGDEVEF